MGERGWADENTSPTRKRVVGIIPRLGVGLVLTPLVQLLAAISSGQSEAPAELGLGSAGASPSRYNQCWRSPNLDQTVSLAFFSCPLFHLAS